MFGHLLEDAKKDAITSCEIALLALKQNEVLLLEEPYLNQQDFYHFPVGSLKEEETISQGLHRILMEDTLLSVSQIDRFLTYRDVEESGKKKRVFYFVVKVENPEDIQAKKYHSYAWAEPKEAVGYPIKDETREILDLYIKS